ncbi:hypothetical protein [Bacteroides sp. 51]|uniref:hypothetical protein n=1 Tax=Bacteroides sp. 51 TaxID=2302938 RepID=UPI0013D677BE|nr:hypothetical protein [Bacteroides sp. 51]NDV84855.1 hypothetical protein [Bacteroides sp. 51]
MAIEKVSVITLRFTKEEAEYLEVFKKLVGKKTASEALRYIISEFPRWNKVAKETFDESRDIKAKYDKIKKTNTNFMLAFQDMVNIVNGDN